MKLAALQIERQHFANPVEFLLVSHSPQIEGGCFAYGQLSLFDRVRPAWISNLYLETRRLVSNVRDDNDC
jgi:hypothetical protein